MLLIGNDVVDLTDPEKKGTSRNARFIDRVFTPAELEWIGGSTDPERTLWTCWAAKEAAFKVVKKSQPFVCSIPRSYPVDLERSGKPASYAGTVNTPAGVVYVRCAGDGETVHAIAASQWDGMNGIVWGLERMNDGNGPPIFDADGPSLFVRRALLQRISDVLGYRLSAMDVRRLREPRGLAPPRLYIHGLPSGVDISLSHDGRMAAYAFSFS